jgi:hypothetical protein
MREKLERLLEIIDYKDEWGDVYGPQLSEMRDLVLQLIALLDSPEGQMAEDNQKAEGIADLTQDGQQNER